MEKIKGVYLLYDKGGTIIYIGKGVHIKERIKDHLGNDLRRSTPFLNPKEIDSFKIIEHSNPALLEKSMIELLHPRCNVKYNGQHFKPLYYHCDMCRDYHKVNTTCLVKCNSIDKIKVLMGY